MTDQQGISVIIPVTERFDEFRSLFAGYRDALDATGRPLQFIYVLDGKFIRYAPELRQLNAGPHSLEVISLSRTFGESAALTIGFERARYDLVMTLPAYHQIETSSLNLLLTAINDADMVVARRWPRKDSAINRLSNRVFHAILRGMTGVTFRDVGCGVRLLRRIVVDEINVYGDQHRFLPILADRRGFRVVEIDLPQATEDTKLRVYGASVYLGRLLDLMAVFFLVRFTKKPLRFFGMLGSILMSAGAIILFVAVLQRYFMDMALADRPILLLGSLFLVLGIQLLAVGLIGELIIFTHAGELKEYVVAETVNMDGGGNNGENASPAASAASDARVPRDSSRI